MPPWDAKLLQEQGKSSLRRFCLECNHILSQQAQRSIIAWERSCQVALKSSGPLTMGMGTKKPDKDHGVKSQRCKEIKK